MVPNIIDFNLAANINEERNYFFGTDIFLPPERFKKNYTTAINQDIYSLGLILCFMLYNKTQLTFASDSKKELATNHASASVHDTNTEEFLIAQQNESIVDDSKSLHPLIKKMTFFKPDERYQSCDEIKKDMDLVLHACTK